MWALLFRLKRLAVVGGADLRHLASQYLQYSTLGMTSYPRLHDNSVVLTYSFPRSLRASL